MKTSRLPLAVVAIVLATAAVLADSPLTSTDLASAYGELPAVKEARATKRVADEVLRVLTSTAPNDHKAAVVNALGWQTPGNAAAFLTGLAAARGTSVDDIRLAQLTASDRFVLGYLLALETYHEPSALRPGALDVWGATPQQLLDQAAQGLPDDFAVHYVRALVEAQRAMVDSGCSAYLATSRVLEKFPPRRRNLRPAAVAKAQSYMDLYKADCAAAPKSAPDPNRRARLTVEHDQNYALARLGDTIVAATQAGIVVWRPDERRPVATRDEQICTSVLVWRDSAWAGCYGRLVRWNGTAWKTYLHDPNRTDAAYAPFPGPWGDLLVRNGGDVWQYDVAGDRFAPIALTFTADPYDVLYRRNQQLWWIDFLEAVVGPKRTLGLQSAEYPGRDPRRLIEDPQRRLWVVDFKDGAFRLDEKSGRFERAPELASEVTDVAVDLARGRTWLLHYNRGPVLRNRNGESQMITVSGAEQMRDLLVDDRTGDLWVATWNGVVRIREENGRWKTDTWRAAR